MLTKEECKLALTKLTAVKIVELLGADKEKPRSKEELKALAEYQKYCDTLQQLIEEHFNNSIDFKHFKLHADSTFKTFLKDELIDYIHMIYRNWQGTDLSCENAIRYNYQLADEIEKQIKRIKELELKEKQWIETEKDYRDELKELKSNPPLKYEELKEFEWYWDNKKKRYFKIFGLDVPNKEIIAFDYWGLGFEENRFYRRQVEDHER